VSDLVAIAYDDQETAGEVMRTLLDLQREQEVLLDDVVVVERDDAGRVRLRQGLKTVEPGAALGAAVGGLIGLVLLAPALGVLVGGAIGAGAAAAQDFGVDDSFLKDLGRRLTPGGAAVVMLVRQDRPEDVLAKIEGFGGEAMRTELGENAEARLREALDQG